MPRLFGLFACLIAAPTFAAERVVEFNRDVRPILSENCFACHGPDASKREANLRLDTEDGAKKLRKSRAAIVSGDVAKSHVLLRLAAADDTHMPPAETGKKVSPEQVATLKLWIEQGAKWQNHWSLEPIARPQPPAVDEPGFTRNSIDKFVLAKLREQKLPHAAEADKRTLIRRLSLDLTGLPPSFAEVEAFANDKNPDAYEKLVDRLMTSPHYGERMAVFWLDLARYADSVGYHGDQEISVSPFRDYVIKAFNDNKKFDRFVAEQLAGDLLPDATLETRVASGYNRLGMMSAEGGAQDKEYRAKYASERVRAVGGAFLGLTLGCAECHDHKFDPISAKDYYRFQAFFADIKEQGVYGGTFGTSIAVPTPEEAAREKELVAALQTLRCSLEDDTPGRRAAQAKWEAGRPKSVGWQPLVPASAKSAGGVTLKVQPDHAVLASGKSPKTDRVTVALKLPKGTWTALRLEALPHDSLPAKGPGRSPNGNFVLSELSAKLGDKAVTLRNASATFEQANFSAAQAIDGKIDGNSGWAVLPEVGRAQAAAWEFAEPIKLDADAALAVELVFESIYAQHALGHFRLSASADAPPVNVGSLASADIQAILAKPAEKRTPDEAKKALAHYVDNAPELQPLRAEVAKVEAALNAHRKAFTSTLVTEAVAPRPIRILPRGNWMDATGEVVSPGTLTTLPNPIASTDKARLSRLDLAKWLVAKENPLTSRVLANRLWRVFFGHGLSRKMDDLGSQGEWPSHPELLDYLAGRLLDQGWDVKAFVREVVLSGAYRMASQFPDAASRERDPLNRYLGRQNRFRLEAEMVRDHALTVSGLLSPKVGGKSAKPYQPPGYWAFLNFPTREWANDTGENLYRRGMYTHWQRQYLHPAVAAFDGPSREECTAERVRSNTPLQSLVLLNDPEYVEASRVFAERVFHAAKTPADRVAYAVREALGRPAKTAEAKLLVELYEKHLADYAKDPAAVKLLLAIGARKPDEKIPAAELAAWASVARALFNHHAAVTRY